MMSDPVVPYDQSHEHVEQPVQLTADDFWVERSAQDLIREQGVEAVHDAASLRMEGISDEEWATFFETLGVRP